MSLTVFYHCFCDAGWREPVEEFLDALDGYPETRPVRLGLVGTAENRKSAVDFFKERRTVEVVAEKDRGWEQVTLIPLSRWVRKNGGLVLYAHTKGVVSSAPFAAEWRRSMTDLVVRDRDYCCSQIWMKGHDLVGICWLTPEQFPGLITSPMFGGNFWIARAGYLRTLPPVRTRDRYDAEAWIGSGRVRPQVLDRMPGWPSPQLFDSHQTKESV